MVEIIVFVGVVLIAIEISDRRRHARENAILLAVNRDLAMRQRRSSGDGASN
jgi:hypothetical protein